MKKLLLFAFILTIISSCISIPNYKQEFGTCFSNGNKKSIANKMDNFLDRVSEETGCKKEEITYRVEEYYTGFYSKECRHLPKRITFDTCGQKRTYKHRGLSGAILYWLLGSWTLEKE